MPRRKKAAARAKRLQSEVDFERDTKAALAPSLRLLNRAFAPKTGRLCAPANERAPQPNGSDTCVDPEREGPCAHAAMGRGDPTGESGGKGAGLHLAKSSDEYRT
mmetsp:Transcript_614/g.2193  ORF Transcript_614/g.2193 Transcript_614/m.2193 type:complete len:105 (+) Transcript_614:498-812(+)